jgi:protease IV
MKLFQSFIMSLGVLAVAIIVVVIFLAFLLSTRPYVFDVDTYKEIKNHIAVLTIEGPIMSESPWLNYLEQINKNTACKGVIIRVNSPGGAVGSSQELYEEIKSLSAAKPVVVSFGNVAASGGYYLSLGTRKIFSNPGTLTGSIGVIMEFPQIGQLLKKWGVEMAVVKSGEFKDAGSMFRAFSENDREYFQSVIDDAYDQFKTTVSKCRKIQGVDLDKITNGKVFTGRQAYSVHLVDTLGTFSDAKNYIRSISGIEKNAPFISLPPKKSWLEKALGSKFNVIQNVLDQSRLFNPGVFYLLPGSMGN